jgi:hypothetical protein
LCCSGGEQERLGLLVKGRRRDRFLGVAARVASGLAAAPSCRVLGSDCSPASAGSSVLLRIVLLLVNGERESGRGVTCCAEMRWE